ncbi:hypothetical protein EJB05_37929, partial [Eragrostis curvula]
GPPTSAGTRTPRSPTPKGTGTNSSPHAATPARPPAPAPRRAVPFPLTTLTRPHTWRTNLPKTSRNPGEEPWWTRPLFSRPARSSSSLQGPPLRTHQPNPPDTMAEHLAAAATFRAAVTTSSSARGAARASRSFFRPSPASPALARVALRSAAPHRLPQRAMAARSAAATEAASDPAQLKAAREDIMELLRTTHCHPILVRLGWHDAGTYDRNIKEWPQRGGANGSLRFDVELKHGANAGLINALKLIQPIKDKYPNITYADLFQLASATAIEEAGGPKIPMKYGRIDVTGPEQCPPEGKLPDAGPKAPADHLREVFYRMGFDDKEIVVLSGAQTLGRSRPERSGWGKPETKYTKNGPGAPGRQSWTPEWLKFDNSYFKSSTVGSFLEVQMHQDIRITISIWKRTFRDLLVLPTDAALFEDPTFKDYAEKYAEDQDTFFKDYAEAHAKLSNLGAEFNPPQVRILIGKLMSAAPEPEPVKHANAPLEKVQDKTYNTLLSCQMEGFPDFYLITQMELFPQI